MKALLGSSVTALLTAWVGLAPPCAAQVTSTTTTTTTTVTHSDDVIHIMPQARPLRHRVDSPVRLSAVGVSVEIKDQVATTLLELSVTNPSGRAQQAEVLLPVPDGAALRSFQYDGTGPEPTARLLPKDEARRIYDSIVNASRDPGLLEFAGLNVIRSSAFPVPPGATQKVRITFEQVLKADAGRVDYVFPRTESLATDSDVPWTIKVDLKSGRPISTVYSPSHDLSTVRTGAGALSVNVTPGSAKGPGAFRLSYLVEQKQGEMSATLMAYPDPSIGDGKGGYFMLLVGLPVQDKSAADKAPKRELTLVIDRSGSMRGKKIEQAKAAALSVVDGLREGEFFNIIDFSDSIASFAGKPVAKDAKTAGEARAYIQRIEANGGTNIHDAVLEALRPEPSAGTMPLVLFLTDGLPTVSERNEVKIRDAAKAANTHKRRMFTFGVGFDVNTPLLTRLAEATRAGSTFVLPEEDVEVKVSQVWRRLSGPALGFPRLTAGENPGSAGSQVREVLPGELPDLFDGDQLLVVGQYTGGEKLKFKLAGQLFGDERTFEMSFDLAESSTRNGFVPRIWATRKIASLLDSVRQASAEGVNDPKNDPKTKELVDEVIRLSLKFGIMTEYTSFLATEPTVRVLSTGVPMRPADAGRVREEATKKLSDQRSGEDAVRQEVNLNALKGGGGGAAKPAGQSANGFYAIKDGKLEEQKLMTVNAIGDRTFYYRGTQWVDGRVIDKEKDAADQTVEVGSKEYTDLAEKLVKANLSGVLALKGDVMVLMEGKRVLLKNGS